MDKETIIWIDTNGTEYTLTDQEDIAVTIGPSGRHMPPIDFTEQEIPFYHGSLVKNTRVKAREMDFPVQIYGETQMDIRNNLRKLLKIFNPLKGDGKIKSISPDGSQREISCRYQGGLEIEESGRIWEKFVLVLKAFDPFWYDSSTIVQTFNINESPGTFFPVFPLALASSTVFASVAINNEGDVDTWPEWEINGPCQGVVLRNLSTGEMLSLDVTLELGESITIDTKPFRKLVVKNDSTNLFYTMSDDSSLWALQEGINGIQIEMGGATLDSSAQLTYRNRYWGP
jgi:phage-related protein